MNALKIVQAPIPQILIERPGGASEAIHPLWLRERCTGPASMDQGTGQRLYNPSDLDADLVLASVSESGNDVLVRFSDGHESRYSRQAILDEAGLSVQA